MANPSSPPPSFSPRRKWSIGFNVVLATIAVFLILIGVNYVSSQYISKRFYLSSDPRVRLSPRTINLLRTLTNQVDVTVYYDKSEGIYAEIMSLLNEYGAYSRKFAVRTVDYYNNPGAAQEVKIKYGMGSATNKDFIIFDCEGRNAFVDGNWLSSYRYELEKSTNQDDSKLYLNRKRIAFNGETLFTAKLFAVTQSKPLKAYFLQGHGEGSPDNKDEIVGFSKLKEVFQRNYVTNDLLNGLSGTNTIPLDCNLLVIIGPRERFETNELDKISNYLDQGGRLFALFDSSSCNRQLGLEAVLAKWNVGIAHSWVQDPVNAVAQSNGRAIPVPTLPLHEIMKPLIDSQLELIMPRPVGRMRPPSQAATDEPQVTDLAFSSTNSILDNNPTDNPRPYPLMAAVEKGAAKGIVTERGTTRMLITGDSLFLNNQLIEAAANQDFADSAVNWLLERPTFLNGVGPRPVKEYRLMTRPGQIRTAKGLLLGAIPGGILLFGGLVWLRRRK